MKSTTSSTSFLKHVVSHSHTLYILFSYFLKSGFCTYYPNGSCSLKNNQDLLNPGALS